jgi:hypothetical protein
VKMDVAGAGRRLEISGGLVVIRQKCSPFYLLI